MKFVNYSEEQLKESGRPKARQHKSKQSIRVMKFKDLARLKPAVAFFPLTLAETDTLKTLFRKLNDVEKRLEEEVIVGRPGESQGFAEPLASIGTSSILVRRFKLQICTL